MKHYYVYALINPRNQEPFYIGKGCADKAYLHLNSKDHNGNVFKDRKIESIRRQGLEPYVKFIKKDLFEQDALDLEEKLIKKYGRKRKKIILNSVEKEIKNLNYMNRFSEKEQKPIQNQ